MQNNNIYYVGHIFTHYTIYGILYMYVMHAGLGSLGKIFKGKQMNKVLEAIELLSKGNDSGEISSGLLLAAKQELERELRDLEVKRQSFQYEMEIKQKAFDSQVQLFNMKWSLLEDETRKLAEESRKAEKRRAFFERVNTYQKVENNKDNIVHGEMFFKGVASPQALKKRYKDLIKIYHPDSEFGDNQTVQEINREYDSLRHAMAK